MKTAQERYGAAGDNSTRRYPRTMTEAFGPHTDDLLYPMPERPRKHQRGELAARVQRLVRRIGEAARSATTVVAGH